MQTKQQQLQRNKKNRKTTQIKGRKRERGFKYNGNKKQAGLDQKPSAIEKDCIGSQGLQRNTALQKNRTRCEIQINNLAVSLQPIQFIFNVFKLTVYLHRKFV